MFPLPLTATGLLATETIDTQDDRFGQRLESLITQLVQDINDGTIVSEKGVKDHPVLTAIETAVYARFKMKITLEVDGPLAAILPFYANTSHIFLHDFFRGNINIRDQAKLLKTFDQKRGAVNLQKATLDGIFSEYDHPVYMNFYQLVAMYNLSAAEITACLLHELGHGFYACYYADRADRTNQVLASIARHLTAHEVGDVEYVYKELVKISPDTKKQDVDKMVNGPRVVAGATWFKTYVEIVRSQTTHDLYNNSSFEQRADNFGSRFGYGKPLVTALDKLSMLTAEKSGAIRFLVQILSIAHLAVLGGLIMGLFATGAFVLAFFFVAYKFLILLIHREDLQDYTYDKLKLRYLRVRQDAVDQLKNLKLKPQLTKDLLAQIYTLDEIIKETKVVKTLPNYIADLLWSKSREAGKAVEDQQILEALASNDLFIKAAEFRTIA